MLSYGIHHLTYFFFVGGWGFILSFSSSALAFRVASSARLYYPFAFRSLPLSWFLFLCFVSAREEEEEECDGRGAWWWRLLRARLYRYYAFCVLTVCCFVLWFFLYFVSLMFVMLFVNAIVVVVESCFFVVVVNQIEFVDWLNRKQAHTHTRRHCLSLEALTEHAQKRTLMQCKQNGRRTVHRQQTNQQKKIAKKSLTWLTLFLLFIIFFFVHCTATKTRQGK